MTEWRARVARERLLCGRKGPDDQDACTGEIAVLAFSTGGVRRAGLRGFVEQKRPSKYNDPNVRLVVV